MSHRLIPLWEVVRHVGSGDSSVHSKDTPTRLGEIIILHGRCDSRQKIQHALKPGLDAPNIDSVSLLPYYYYFLLHSSILVITSPFMGTYLAGSDTYRLFGLRWAGHSLADHAARASVTSSATPVNNVSEYPGRSDLDLVAGWGKNQPT